MKKFIKILCILNIILGMICVIFNYLYGFDNIKAYSFKQTFSSDDDYKMQIIKESKINDLILEDIESIVGPYELCDFLKSNHNNPKIYMPSYRENGIFQANLHFHTTISDGKLTPKEVLNLANDYAKTIYPKKFYIAITDHNKTQSDKEILEILNTDAEKYKNLKIVLGMEVFSYLKPTKFISKDKIQIHLVALAINPFDKNLNEIFYDRKIDRTNYSERTFEDATKLLNQKGIVGIAHPARFINKNNAPNSELYFNYLYNKYKFLTRNNFSFTEAYYQSYNYETYRSIRETQQLCNKFKIVKSGSIDNHGKDFFKKY